MLIGLTSSSSPFAGRPGAPASASGSGSRWFRRRSAVEGASAHDVEKAGNGTRRVEAAHRADAWGRVLRLLGGLLRRRRAGSTRRGAGRRTSGPTPRQTSVSFRPWTTNVEGRQSEHERWVTLTPTARHRPRPAPSSRAAPTGPDSRLPSRRDRQRRTRRRAGRTPARSCGHFSEAGLIVRVAGGDPPRRTKVTAGGSTGDRR